MLRPESLAATGLTEQETVTLLDGFLVRSERVVIRQRLRPSIQDPADEMFVEALVNGGGDAIVTFNRRDYLTSDHRLASKGKMFADVIAPGEALRRLTWRPTAITPFAFPPR